MKKNRKKTPSDLSRREFLGRTGASVTLAAGAALAPFALSGCSGGGTTSGGTPKKVDGPGPGPGPGPSTTPSRPTPPFPDTKPAKSDGLPDGDPVKVGILHSLTGTMAISEISLKEVELMAIDEINAAGGVVFGGKKHKIEAVIEDPESKFTDVFPEKAKKLLLKDKVAVVFGCWTSVSRKNVLPVFEENNGLLFYPVQYEGNECSPNIVYTGAAPNQQIIPAVDWLLEDIEKRTKKKPKDQKWYLIGTDYVFPRTANLIVIEYLRKVKGVDIDPKKYEKYTGFGHKDYATIVQDIKAYGPDVVFSTINGDSNINFYNEMATAGLTADKCPICAVSVGEDELRGLDKLDAFKGHYAAWNYYQSLDTPANKEFVKRFKAKYGKDRVTDDPIEAAYFQVYFWKLAVELANSIEVDEVRKAFKNKDGNPAIGIEAPGGKVMLDPETQHTYKFFRMGKIREDKQFDIVYETPIVRPEPYPQEVFEGWNCNWVKNPKKGQTKGKEVKIGS